MINTYSIKKVISTIGVATLGLGLALTASAASVGVSVKASTVLPSVIAKSDTAIGARITALNNLSARIQAMQNVSDSVKNTIATEVQTQIDNLTNLKAKIDGDTDVVTARADVKTMISGYRIYALVIPRGYIVASSDRVATIVSLMTTLQAKLQVRITALQTAGKDVKALQAAYADITTKTADATAKVQAAQAAVISLVADQGDATIAASNKAAFATAHTNIKAANVDLKAAREDIKTIIAGLKVKPTAAASVSAGATTNQ